MAKVVREAHEVSTSYDDDVATTDRTVNDEHGMDVVERIVYMIGGIVVGLLAIRFLLSLLGANRANEFADFIYSITMPFVSPFFGLFNYTAQYGISRFEFETLVAILVWGLLTVLIAKLVTIGRRT